MNARNPTFPSRTSHCNKTVKALNVPLDQNIYIPAHTGMWKVLFYYQLHKKKTTRVACSLARFTPVHFTCQRFYYCLSVWMSLYCTLNICFMDLKRGKHAFIQKRTVAPNINSLSNFQGFVGSRAPWTSRSQQVVLFCLSVFHVGKTLFQTLCMLLSLSN